MTNVQSLERDVAACGVPLGDVRRIAACYERALRSGAAADWLEVYIGTFVTLLRRAHRVRPAEPHAARRLLLLMSDDLGVSLFDAQARLQLEMTLRRSAA